MKKNVLDKMIYDLDGSGQNENGNKIQMGIADILVDIKEHPKLYTSMVLVPFIAGMLFSGYVCSLWLKLFGSITHVTVKSILTSWMNLPGIIIMLVATVLLIKIFFRIHRINMKDYYTDREGNFYISKRGTQGNAHWQTEKERQECFERSKDIRDLTGDILGKDDEGRLYTLRSDLVGINRNKCILGTPGSGKSAGIIENDIIQCIRRGESAVITDSKGDLYAKMSQFAKKAGYIVKVLNVKPEELKNSDAFDFMKYLAGADPSEAEVLARAIIENTGEYDPRRGMDYWAQNEMNCYKALMLRIANDPARKKIGKCNLGEMYDICTTMNAEKLAFEFQPLPANDPAKQAFNIFANCEARNQGQILNGMGVKLSFLTNENARKIVSHDEIDLTLPMKKKCMYFVIISDTNKAYNVIANLFFNLMLIKQCAYSDSLTPEKKEKQIYVNYILDEYKATGSINNFDGAITTVRSRKIGFTIALQTLGQLEDMHPGKAYDTILGSMTVKLLLRSGDQETSEFFTAACGKQTRMSKGNRYSDAKDRSAHIYNSMTANEAEVGVDLFPVDETQKMDADRLVAVILGFQPVKLYKYLSYENPYIKGWEKGATKANRRLPKWRKQEQDAEKARQLEMEKMREEYENKGYVDKNDKGKKEKCAEEEKERTQEAEDNIPGSMPAGSMSKYEDYEGTPAQERKAKRKMKRVYVPKV